MVRDALRFCGIVIHCASLLCSVRMNTPTPVLLAAIAVISATSLRAVTLGQIDTFQDNTTAGWHVGPASHPAPPSNVGGGAGGAADRFLRVNALGGAGPGSRFSVLSGPQWGGDYLAAGINALVMDVRNFGPDDLSLRLLFEDIPAMGPPTNLALSSTAVLVPGGGDWTTIAFPVTVGSLLPETFGTVEGALRNADVVRLFHNPAPAFPGPSVGPPAVVAILGVDNIRAVAAVPESPVSGAGVLALTLAVIAASRRYRSALPRRPV